MGWLRVVGSLELQVAFAEYGLFYRALLQKRPMILRSLIIVATPYVSDIPYRAEIERETTNRSHLIKASKYVYGVATISRLLKIIGHSCKI